MTVNRREFGAAGLGALAACGKSQEEAGWPAAWNTLLLEKAVSIESEKYDPKERMVTRLVGPGYQYHTRIRDRRVHPTRESLEYALYLLSLGGKFKNGEDRGDRARAVISKVISLQDTDPASKWYGIWGWYAEEPASQMSPADWNWADFNGSLLLMTEILHGEKLGGELRKRVLSSIRDAAYSVRQRNVAMAYTNIAIKGTYVTLAAAQVLNDDTLRAYAFDRLTRLEQTIDQTGGFAEYNSPTYTRVSLTSLTRMRMTLKDRLLVERAGRIERRLWLAMAEHWDQPRKQFAGPMSRCYSTDLGYPAWLEKSLDGQLNLVHPENRTQDRGGITDGETAIHAYHCPHDLYPRFLEPPKTRLHRELFLKGKDGAPPVLGTTYLSPAFSLGSVNRGDFWVQRRPLLAYFGDDARPAKYASMRVVKDGYDFSSALLFSVQADNAVLGLINFRNPGGDKHISLDPIEKGEFKAGKLFLELFFEGLPEGFTAEADDSTLVVKSGLIQAWFRVMDPVFGKFRPKLKATRMPRGLVATLDLLPEGASRIVRWKDTLEAAIPFCFALQPPEAGDFAAGIRSSAAVVKPSGKRLDLSWTLPSGTKLALSGSNRVAPVEDQIAAFTSSIDGQSVPVVRLSDQKLAS